MTFIANTGTTKPSFDRAARGCRFAVEDNYWGYVVRATDGPKLTLQVTRFLALMSGACFAAAALGMLLLPEFLAGEVSMIIRSAAVVAFASLAAYLIWYARLGAEVEFQIDTNRGEVRQIARNPAGGAYTLDRYGFDIIGSVFIDRTYPNPNEAALKLRFGNSPNTVIIAYGNVEELSGLRDRLGRDMVMGI